MKLLITTKTLEQALREAQNNGFKRVYDPMTMIHSNIDEFVDELSNENADFISDEIYVRFGNLIVSLNDAWGDYSEYYELIN